MTVATLQVVFREAAGLEVDGTDLPRCNAVLTRTLYRLLDRIPATETKARFPDLVGGLTVALARTFLVVSPGLTRPGPGHWETVRSLTDLYL